MSDAIQGPFVAPTIPGGGQNIPAIGIRIPIVSTKLHSSAIKLAVLEAIELGYRHLQTFISCHLEHHQAIGEAIVEALQRGLLRSREELFVTSKIEYRVDDAGVDAIIKDLMLSLKKLNLEYIDLYLIECPEKLNNDISPTDHLMGVWAAMEECQRHGLTKSIGVCKFSSKMLENLLKHAKLPPCVNQMEMHSLLREKELGEFCLVNRISIIASSTVGENEKHLSSTQFLQSDVLNEIARDGQKTANQIVFRWAYEQGAALLLESLSKEHMQEILEISEWRLSQDD